MKIVIVLSIAFGAYVLYFVSNSIMIPAWVTRNPIGPESDEYYFNPITSNVFHSPMGNWFSLGYSQVSGITKKSKVQFLKRGVLVADDKIFVNGDKLAIAYAQDFQWLPPYHFISNSKVYFKNDFRPADEIVGADATTFKTLNAFGYAKDSKNVYYFSDVILRADVNSYQMAKDSYTIGWDSTQVFFRAPKTKENPDDYMIYSILHSGVITEGDEFILDSKFIYFFDYRNFKIRKEAYQNAKSVKNVDLGIEIDGRLIPRSEYLSD